MAAGDGASAENGSLLGDMRPSTVSMFLVLQCCQGVSTDLWHKLSLCCITLCKCAVRECLAFTEVAVWGSQPRGLQDTKAALFGQLDAVLYGQIVTDSAGR